MIIVRGGVTAPSGFLANGVRAGIKKSGKMDAALIYSEAPAIAAGSFTTNRFQASPIKVSKLHLKNKTHQAIIVNSGNANCMNGQRGDEDAVRMAGLAAEMLLLERREVLVASTGIIGRRLPIEKIEKVVPDLAVGLSRENGGLFSEAILTTDTKRKDLAVRFKLGRSIVIIGGSCKGAGMIYPEMKTERHATLRRAALAQGRPERSRGATMLAFITTDVSISKQMLGIALDDAVSRSFNMVSVDGDMSTNDSCFILANGMAGNKRIDKKDKDYDAFLHGLRFLTRELAKMIARDGEGATKFVEIEVAGAESLKDARHATRKISTSNLLKCCIFGEDPNWGRIAAALGSSGVLFDPSKVDIFLGGMKVLAGGRVTNYGKNRTKAVFKKKEIHIKADLHSGSFKASAWTCDLSKEYVAINSEYST